jgi:hypothetical protein
MTNQWKIDEKKPSLAYLADPTTGSLQRAANLDGLAGLEAETSPDGKHQFHVGKTDLTITELPNGKVQRFAFHEYDLRFVGPDCVEWISPRYLKFNGPRLSLIDIDSMKMCFPALADGSRFPSAAYKFTRDMRWVAYQGETEGQGSFYLAPVELPDSR